MVKRVMACLAAAGYAASVEISSAIALLLSQCESLRAMLLDGPPGSGKTALAKAVARVLGVDYVYIQAHHGSSPEEFLYEPNLVQILRGVAGDSSAVKTAEDVVDLGFLPTVFRQSQTRPVVAFVDELDKSSHKTDSFFLAALQEGEIVIKGLGRIKANPENLIIFFTKNDERQVSEPLMRRCRRHYLGFPKQELEVGILTGKFKPRACEALKLRGIPVETPTKVAVAVVELAKAVRRYEAELIKPPATQELQMACADAMRLVGWREFGQISGTVEQWMLAYQEDKTFVRRALGKTLPALLQAVELAARASAGSYTVNQVAEVTETFDNLNVGRAP